MTLLNLNVVNERLPLLWIVPHLFESNLLFFQEQLKPVLQHQLWIPCIYYQYRSHLNSLQYRTHLEVYRTICLLMLFPTATTHWTVYCWLRSTKKHMFPTQNPFNVKYMEYLQIYQLPYWHEDVPWLIQLYQFYFHWGLWLMSICDL